MYQEVYRLHDIVYFFLERLVELIGRVLIRERVILIKSARN